MKLELSLAFLLDKMLLNCLVYLSGSCRRLAEVKVKTLLLLLGFVCLGAATFDERIGIEEWVIFDALAVVCYGHDQIEFVRCRGVNDLEELHDVRMVNLLHDLDLLVDIIKSCCEVLQEALSSSGSFRRGYAADRAGSQCRAPCEASLLFQVRLHIYFDCEVLRNVVVDVDLVEDLDCQVNFSLAPLTKALENSVLPIEDSVSL